MSDYDIKHGDIEPIMAQAKPLEEIEESSSKMNFSVSIEGIEVSEKQARKYIKDAIKFWMQHYKEGHPKFEGVEWEEAKIKVKIVKEES